MIFYCMLVCFICLDMSKGLGSFMNPSITVVNPEDVKVKFNDVKGVSTIRELVSVSCFVIHVSIRDNTLYSISRSVTR